MRTARTSIGTLVATAAVSLGAIGLAVAAPGGGTRRDEVRLQSAAGAVAIGNSREGQALFSASGMRPGQSSAGTVLLSHTGEDAGAVWLAAAVAHEAPGQGGGRLTDELLVTIADVTPGHGPQTLWSGAAGALAHISLGSIAAGEARTYAVNASLPTSAGNAYQAASVSLDLHWTLQVAAAAPAPTATPTPTPGATPAPAPAPPTTGEPPVAVTQPVVPAAPSPVAPTGSSVDVAGEALGVPPARACASRRHFKIKLHAPPGATMRTAVVRVNGKVRGRARGARATVDLRGLPKGRAVVAIVVVATDGRTFRSTRTFRTCNAA